jgi:subtilisin-like proprotein convertase family protein
MTVTSIDSTYGYTWVPGTGLSDSTLATVSAGPLTTTTYIVFAESPINGCKTSDTLTVVVNPLPIGYFTPTDTTICIGDSSLMSFAYEPVVMASDSPGVTVPDSDPLGIRDTLTISGGPTVMTSTSVVSVCFDMTHTWDGDMSFTLISPSGTALDLCSNNGGSSDNFFGTCFTPGAAANITTGTAPFTGNWIPEGAGAFNVFNGENSNGEWKLWMVDGAGGDVGFLIQWSITLQNGAATWTWSSDPAGFTSTADSVWVSPDTTTIYTVTLQDSASGCTQPYSWTLNVNPPLDVFILPAAPTVCPGDSVILVATATGGDGAINYSWSPSGISFSAATITPAGEEMHVVTITDGCTTPAVNDTVYIHYADSILGNVTADTTICEGQSVTLTATVTDGGGTYFYLWSTGDTTASITVSPVVTTTYTVTYTDNCGNSGVDSILVTVDPLPVAGFTFTPTDPEVGQLITFTNTSTDATSYSWNFGGAGFSTLTDPTFTFPVVGPTFVQLIATNDCGSDTLIQSIDILVAGSEPFADGSAVVYPNPNSGSFSLALTGMEGRDLDIRIVNMVGQQVHSSKATVVGRNMDIPFTLNVPTGVYLLEVRSGDEVVRFNVTVQ